MRADRLLPFLLLSAPLLPRPAAARALHDRVGLGFDAGGAFPALSARYGLPMPSDVMNLLVELDAGFATGTEQYLETTTGGFSVGGRLLYGLVAEDNLHLYGSAGAWLVSLGGDARLRLQPAIETEFFLFGLENLGFAASFGIAVDLGTPSGVATFGTAPGLGLHYYF